MYKEDTTSSHKTNSNTPSPSKGEGWGEDTPSPVGEGRGGVLAYCCGDVLLTIEGKIPTALPFEVKPWQEVTRIEVDSDAYTIIRLDSPIVGHPDYQMVGLRKAYTILSTQDYELAGKGAELIYWHQNTTYCGVCGAPLKWQTEISKKCPQCGKEWWPSPATAIIVRVSRGEEILMVHPHNMKGRYHGLVAGFVEMGETLEETVIREVREETGIRIRNVRYFGSQPWPFPCGLMVGFTADYDSGQLHLQHSELSSGGWFTPQNHPDIPPPGSIARDLIDDWLQHYTP